MPKTGLLIAALLAATAAATASSAAVVGKDAAACIDGKPAVQVRLSGFKRASGTVKVALYRSEGYLAKRGKLRKVVVPVNSAGPLDVCIAVPQPGLYAIAVHHDLNGNGDKDASDGAGYSRNPRLSITNLKPAFKRTAIEVGPAPRAVSVQLQYRKGLSVAPVSG